MANSYLSRSESSAGSSTKGTLSAWLKRSKITSEYPRIFSSYIDNSNHWKVYFDNTDRLNVYGEAGGSLTNQVITTRKFKDTDAFYHIVVAVDSTQGSSSDRVKVYVNGVQETAFDTATYPSSSANMKFNGGSGNTDTIGKKEGASSDYFNGYMSHVSWVDGAALAPTSFGSTDATSGMWKFKAPSGITWGTNGVHLKFENSGSLGLDSSGETNNFTVNGSLKQSIDTPSNNFITMNVLDNQNQASTFTMANTKIEWNTSNKTNFGAWSMNKGKWYWELKYADNTGGANLMTGIVRDPTGIGSRDPSDWPGHDNNGFSYYAANGSKYYNGSGSSYGNSFTTNDIVGVAFNADTRTLWFSKNGTWQNSATISEIAAGTTTNSAWTGIGSASNEWFPATSGYDGNKAEFNFGNGYFSTTPVSSAGTSSTGDDSVWEYDCPTGFYGLNTKNLNTYG